MDQVQAQRWVYVQVRRWLDQVALQRLSDAAGVTGPGAVTAVQTLARSVSARSRRDRARSLGTWSDTHPHHSNGRRALALITGDVSSVG